MARKRVDLDRWPSKGNRRRLEEEWLAVLERDGLIPHLMEVPLEAPRELHQAIDEFNGGRFWDCHETLEDVWRGTSYPLRFFYHSVIKVAVGFHHMGRHNRNGARAKLSDGVRLLRLLQPQFLGVRTDSLLQDAAQWLVRVDGVTRVDWDELDALPRPKIRRTPAGAFS